MQTVRREQFGRDLDLILTSPSVQIS